MSNSSLSSRQKFESLTHNAFILPSVLASNFARLEADIRALEEAGAQALHLDIMDGHFVPNLSFGIPVVEAIRQTTDLVLDVHLMLSHPAEYFGAFRKAGADALTFHVEAVADELSPGGNCARQGCDPARVPDAAALVERVGAYLDSVHQQGLAAGLSIIPPTPAEILAPWLSQCENILIMSVMPGFGGQSFHPETLAKLQRLREHAPSSLLRSIDGGVNEELIPTLKLNGATGFVMGTALFHCPDLGANFKRLHAVLENESV
ncbi:MAG: ribulose-phosphate 3-epimerase [Planctomycetia bacterium]|nr:ribulose-phosphate 3-epimerase [Planctomycetia bacterium]